MGEEFDQDRFERAKKYGNFLKPQWSSDPIPGEQQLHWFGADDTNKILQGYACGQCACDFQGHFHIVCPLCMTPTNVGSDVQPFPEVWSDHLAARKVADDGWEDSTRPVARPTMADWVASVGRDPNVEQVSLSKLGKSKWGRS